MPTEPHTEREKSPTLLLYIQKSSIRRALTRAHLRHAGATDGRVATVAVEVAHFFAEMGRALEATQMYETILAQPPSVLNATPESRHQVV